MDIAQTNPNTYRHCGFWVKNRIRLTLLGVLILPVLSWRFGSPDMARWSFGPGALLTLGGVALRLWSAGWLHKGQKLATGGPYALARHPLYLGTGLIALGHGLMSALWPAPVVFPALWLALYLPAMRDEEAFLERQFGTAYQTYRRATGVLWPRFGRRVEGADKIEDNSSGFSWRQAKRNREYEGAIVNALLIALYWAMGK